MTPGRTARHAFVQHVVGDRVRERGRRAEWDGIREGWVLEAAYLEPPSGLRQAMRRGWIGWLLDRIFDAPESEQPTPARLLLPFTEDGRDALGLLTEALPGLEPGAAEDPGVRRVAGEVVRLAGRDGPVLRDLWITEGHPPSRVVEMEDFAVRTEDGASVVVSCGLAPLVVARPDQVSLRSHIADLGPAVPLLAHADMSATGRRVVVASGDRVEVRGAVRPIDRTARTFSLDGWGGGYRDPPPRPTAVLGDEDGIRLVIAVGAASGRPSP